MLIVLVVVVVVVVVLEDGIIILLDHLNIANIVDFVVSMNVSSNPAWVHHQLVLLLAAGCSSTPSQQG